MFVRFSHLSKIFVTFVALFVLSCFPLRALADEGIESTPVESIPVVSETNADSVTTGVLQESDTVTPPPIDIILNDGVVDTTVTSNDTIPVTDTTTPPAVIDTDTVPPATEGEDIIPPTTTPPDPVVDDTTPPIDDTALPPVVVPDTVSEIPTISEEITDTGKVVVVSATPEQELLHTFIDVPVSTEIPEIFRVGQEDQIKIQWSNNQDQEMQFTASDDDGNGFIDHLAWVVPHLSTQTFEIILISNAFRLDADKNVLEDIFS